MDDANRKLRRATIFFWVLLLYIVAALVWWFVSLERQNAAMFNLKKEEIKFLLHKMDKLMRDFQYFLFSCLALVMLKILKVLETLTINF